MPRSALAAILVLAFITAPLAVEAQPPEKVYRIGVLSQGGAGPLWGTLQNALRERGWVDGRNVAFEYRFAEGRVDRLPALAAELVERQVDVIVAGLGATSAAMEATSSIPIVMTFGVGEVEAGLIGSLAQPRANVTGLTGDVTTEIMGKRLELLREIVPRVRRVAVLYARTPGTEPYLQAFEAAARRLGLVLHLVEIRGAHELERAFTTIRDMRPDALFCGGDPVTMPLRARIADFAMRTRLPSVHGPREWADVGGLVSLGVSLPEVFRRAASYVDRILRGAKPGDLPIERPLKYELVLNRKTANALGLTIPQSLLFRADEVIQ